MSPCFVFENTTLAFRSTLKYGFPRLCAINTLQCTRVQKETTQVGFGTLYVAGLDLLTMITATDSSLANLGIRQDSSIFSFVFVPLLVLFLFSLIIK